VKNIHSPIRQLVALLLGRRAIAAAAFAGVGLAASIFNGTVRAGNVDLVNMYIGTANIPGDRGTEYGGTMPLVEPPFAMTSWTPQTRQNKVSATSYAYGDSRISGFIGTHQAAIWMGDYGYVTLMPGVDKVKTAPEARSLPYTHANEVTTPYYYAVSMDAGAKREIKAELTATEHCALMRFTFPQNTNASIFVEATRKGIIGQAAVNPATQEISGYNPDRMDAELTTLQLPNFKGYFVVQISKPFAGFGVSGNTRLRDGMTNLTGPNVGAYATFNSGSNEAVEVRAGASFISLEQARANLRAELPDWNFEAAKSNLQNAWNSALDGVSLQGGTADQRIQFYTALHHCLLYPRLFSEHGRYYSAFDDRVHEGIAYTDFSGWDIFRSEFSCITLFCPERVNGMIQALLNDFREGGWMPKWPNPSYTDIMLSTPADSIVAEAVNKGFHGFDSQLAYQAVSKDAMTPPNEDTSQSWPDRSPGKPYAAREGLTYYLKYGYVPDNWTARAASCTLEHAYHDWCVAQVAKSIGQTKDYQYFLRRSLNYRNVFNPATGLMNSRKADGSWAPADHGWTEGGQDLYTFAVMHDVPGLMELMGGEAAFNRTLATRTVDLNGLVNNEPGNHYLYLYDFSGAASLCQASVRAALTNFSNTAGGLPGNDDCGQTSSWLLFANLGFYPCNPASGIYMVGSPLFERATLHLPNGRTFVIAATNNSSQNKYIQSATLDGHALEVPWLTYAQIEAGGSLLFVMGPSPSLWASGWRGEPIRVTAPASDTRQADTAPAVNVGSF
jgi:predicted alpha-1,2-mannosidase